MASLQGFAETLDEFLAPRFITTVVVTLLIAAAALLLSSSASPSDYRIR